MRKRFPTWHYPNTDEPQGGPTFSEGTGAAFWRRTASVFRGPRSSAWTGLRVHRPTSSDRSVSAFPELAAHPAPVWLAPSSNRGGNEKQGVDVPCRAQGRESADHHLESTSQCGGRSLCPWNSTVRGARVSAQIGRMFEA